MKITIQDLTLRGQLSKLKCGYGDDLSWTKLSDKELKEDFFKTINKYKENEQYLSSSEKDYLKMLEDVRKIVYSK